MTAIPDDQFNFFLSPLLRKLGYESEVCLRELGQRGIKRQENFIGVIPRWSLWQGILEYLSCVEFARHALKALPHGNKIESVHKPAARYHAASLIFFSQATMDQIAVWLKRELRLVINGKKCQLHKGELMTALIRESHTGLVDVLKKNAGFLRELERFRQTWIHSLAGDASGFIDKPPDQGGVPILAVPIDPAINIFTFDERYYQQVQACRERNNGRWLYPIGEFADRFADGTKKVTTEILAAALFCMT